MSLSDTEDELTTDSDYASDDSDTEEDSESLRESIEISQLKKVKYEEPIPLIRYTVGVGTSAQKSKIKSGVAEIGDGELSLVKFPPSNDDLVEEIVSESLRCPICKDIFDSPVVTVPCGHIFCCNCVEQSGGKGYDGNGKRASHCPVCRTALSCGMFPPARTVQDILNEKWARCPNSMAFNLKLQKYVDFEAPILVDGYKVFRCEQKVLLGEKEIHFKSCKFTPLHCSYKVDGCPKVAMRSDIATHESICDFRAKWCDCGMRVQLKDSKLHDEVCVERSISCPHVSWGCVSPPMKRKRLKRHLSSCAFEECKSAILQRDNEITRLKKEVQALRQQSKKDGLKSRILTRGRSTTTHAKTR